MHKDGKKWFIFRHFNCFRKFYCKSLEEEKLLLFAKRRRDFYYYSFVAKKEKNKTFGNKYIKRKFRWASQDYQIK